MQIDVVHAYSSYWRFIPKKQGKLSCKTLKNREIKGHPYYSLSDNFYDKGRYLKQELVAVSVDILVDEALYTWIERV